MVVEEGLKPEKALDLMCIRFPCCRTRFLTHMDLISRLLFEQSLRRVDIRRE